MAAASSGNKPAKPQEFNPRSKGYGFMLLLSLVNFASVSNLDLEDNAQFQGGRQLSVAFGAITFTASVVILILDRCQYCCTKNDDNEDRCSYTKSMDGNIEGGTLLFLTIWWIIGVAYMTQVGGVAYVANNIYFSSWLTLFACIYTLDQWSAAKDILSISELTGLSATLKSWYLLFLASIVAMGTCCDLTVHLSEDFTSAAAYGIVLGLISTLISLFLILVHYRLVDFEFLQVGGWIELSASFFMILVWVIGVSILTSEGGIAATLGGTGCAREKARLERDNGIDEYESKEGCYIVWTLEDSSGEQATLQPTISESPTPVVPTSQPSIAATILTTSPTMSNETASPEASPSTTTPNETDSPEGLTSTETPESVSPSETQRTDEPSEFLITGSPSEGPSISAITQAPTIPPTSDLQDAENDDLADVDGLGDGGDDDIVVTIEVSNRTTDGNNGTSQPRWLQETDSLFPFNESNQTFVPSPYPSALPSSFPSSSPSSPPSLFYEEMRYERRAHCSAIVDQQIPGSNLYLAAWICFFASFNITLRWKAAQALQFAQAQNRKATEGMEKDGLNDSERDDDDDGEKADDDDEVDDSAQEEDL